MTNYGSRNLSESAQDRSGTDFRTHRRTFMFHVEVPPAYISIGEVSVLLETPRRLFLMLGKTPDSLRRYSVALPAAARSFAEPDHPGAA